MMPSDIGHFVSLSVQAIAAGVLGWGLTGLVRRMATRVGVVAAPTARGLHSRPTPVGGGLGFLLAAVVLWVVAVQKDLIDTDRAAGVVLLLLPVALLITVSVMDDRAGLPVGWRLCAQVVAVGWVLVVLPEGVRIFDWLPLVVERMLIGVAWVWTINAVNFMDGIDGFAGLEAVTVAGGYAIVSMVLPHDMMPIVPLLPQFALFLAAAVLGFLVWNWAPARIFMGDTGSVPLGFVFGLFGLDLAVRGAWAAALILPLYFIIDATVTLLWRIQRGARPSEAHREHAFQRAVLSGMGHDAVCLWLAVLNVVLVMLAVMSLTFPVLALAAAAVSTAALFAAFYREGLRSPAVRVVQGND